MKLTGYKVKDKKALGLFAAAVVIIMFVIRYFLLSSGTIDEMYTLDEDELSDAITAYEVIVAAEDLSENEVTYVGGGTILDARKASASDEEYTLTIAAALSVTGTSGEARAITVTLPDGTAADAVLIAFHEGDGYALIQCSFPEEAEVYYSRDILYRLAEDEPVYVLSDGVIIEGSVTDPDAEAPGSEEDVIESLMEFSLPDTLTGAGLYGKSGNYLGMILETGEDGTLLYSIPGDVIMAALDAAL